MHCTARSVIHGTTISTFGADVVEIVDGSPAVGEDTRILMRFSGPAIDATGIGEGFSGSPVSCPGAGGVWRVVGAISEGIGEYGNKIGLVTPIEQVLGQSVTPPRGTRARAALLRRARPLATLTVSGVPASLRPVVRAAARRAHRSILVTPGGPAWRRFAPNPLLPGAAVSIGLANGDFAIGAIGTVTYRDGARLWAFGHSLEGVGRRSLLLQDAYVYDVVNNPLGTETTTYKLAAPGHDVGTLTGDGPNAVAGLLGPRPPRTAFSVRIRDRDTGRVTRAAADVADETDVGNPNGFPPLQTVASLGTAIASSNALRGAPSDESARMCASLSVREIRRKLRLCNRYVDSGPAAPELGGGTALAAAFTEDLLSAVTTVQGATFAPLHVTRMHVELSMWRGLRQAFMRSASVPKRVRPGQRIVVRLHARRFRGRPETYAFAVRIPAALEPGRRIMVLAGPASDSGDLTDVLAGVLGGAGGMGAEELSAPVQTPAGIAAAVRRLSRFDGVSVIFPSLPSRDGGARPGRPAFRDAEDRITGALKVPLRVVKR
jgi:hypothetical protein